MRDVLVIFSKPEGRAAEVAFEISSFGGTTKQIAEDAMPTQQTGGSGRTQEDYILPPPSQETTISIDSALQCQVFTASLLRVRLPPSLVTPELENRSKDIF